jgi:hypothetical protein
VLEDLQWSEQRLRDNIQRRADRCADAKIDTAIPFGFIAPAGPVAVG